MAKKYSRKWFGDEYDRLCASAKQMADDQLLWRLINIKASSFKEASVARQIWFDEAKGRGLLPDWNGWSHLMSRAHL